MIIILFILGLTLLTTYLIQVSMVEPELGKKKLSAGITGMMVLLVSGLIVRLIGTALYPGHNTDMNCFSAWSDMIFRDGFSNFYASEAFTDYPPGYMYILYIIGFIKNIFSLNLDQSYILIKIPAILCDLVTTYLIYQYASKKFHNNISMVLASFYLFNPAVFTNSALWGQVDSVFTMLLVIMVILVSEKKLIASYFIFAVSIFIKPQAFIFTPILIYGIIDSVFLPKFNKRAFWKHLGFGICAIGIMFLLALPFGIGHVTDQYLSTLASYPYATVNAFNLWGAFGQNWVGLTAATSFIGNAFLVLIVIASAIIFFKSKHESKYFFIAAFLSFSTFMLSTKMHDRYAFPAMVMLLLAYISLPKKHLFHLYTLMTASQFFNTAYVLFIYETDPNKYYKGPSVILASVLNIALYAYFIWVSKDIYINNHMTQADLLKQNIASTKKAASVQKNNKKMKIETSSVLGKITRFDIIAMAVITALYAGIALYNLGDRKAPETNMMLNEQKIVLDLGNPTALSKVKFFLGSYELSTERAIQLSFSDFADGTNAVKKEITDGSVFAWNDFDVPNQTAQYITISTGTKPLSLIEFAVIDASGQTILPINTADFPSLFDEQNLVPAYNNYRNSTYFDEIYHARTGYEFVHSLSPYEWTHPPLGKVFIAIGIKLFGMNPFGWRIAGTVFGIFMVPIMYVFAKRIFKLSWLSVAACLLFTFDFMHFAQTRIATIDVYGTFFIMLMYYFMFKYYSMSFYDTKLSKTFTPLALSGIFMGFGAASKWTGVYAGLGLGVIFLIIVYKRYKEYQYALQTPKGTTNGISHQYIIAHFKGFTLKTIGFCCIFFIAVPVLIYGLSYIPYLQADGMHGIQSILENQVSMYTYHGKTVLDSTHPFSSHWYQWPVMTRPIWYFSGTISSNLKEGISSFGNPAVWWVGIAAFFYVVMIAFKNKDKVALFLVLSYLAQLVAWIPITRLTFIYHYFPCVPFVVLLIAYAVYTIYQNSLTAQGKKKVIIGTFVYTGIALVLFAMFYPVLSGMPVDPDYVKTFLKWFDSWVLI